MPFMELVARVGIDGSAVQAGLAKVTSAVGAARAKIGGAIGGAAKSQLGQALGVAAVLQFAKSTIDMGGALVDTSARLGVSVEELQKWNYAATQSGASAEDVTGFFEKLAISKKKALGGDKAAIRSFKELGVTMDDLAKKDTAGIGLQIGNAIQAGDPQELISALRGVGGRGAGSMIAPMKAGLQPAFDSAESKGLIITTNQAEKLDEVGDKIDESLLRMRAPMAALLEWAVFFFEKMMDGFALIQALGEDYYGFIAAKTLDLIAVFKGDFSGANSKDFAANSEFAKVIESQRLRDTTRADAADAKEIAARDAAKNAAEKSGDVKKLQEETSKNPAANQTLTENRIARDSLAKIGGFTFSRESEQIQIAKDQVKVLEKIEENTKTISEEDPLDDGL